MGVHVRDLKDNGKAWIVVYDRRVPKGYLRKYVGSDWKAAKRAASIIRERLAANDLTFLHGGSSFRRGAARTSPSGWHSRETTPSPNSNTSGPLARTPSPCSEAGKCRRV